MDQDGHRPLPAGLLTSRQRVRLTAALGDGACEKCVASTAASRTVSRGKSGDAGRRTRAHRNQAHPKHQERVPIRHTKRSPRTGIQKHAGTRVARLAGRTRKATARRWRRRQQHVWLHPASAMPGVRRARAAPNTGVGLADHDVRAREAGHMHPPVAAVALAQRQLVIVPAHPRGARPTPRHLPCEPRRLASHANL